MYSFQHILVLDALILHILDLDALILLLWFLMSILATFKSTVYKLAKI